jgi:antitoxin Phd
MTKWSLQDAKNHFSKVVLAARKSPQTVTKHGKPAVVIVDAKAYERLTQKPDRRPKSFVEHLLAMPKGGEDFERLKPKARDVEF